VEIRSGSIETGEGMTQDRPSKSEGMERSEASASGLANHEVVARLRRRAASIPEPSPEAVDRGRDAVLKAVRRPRGRKGKPASSPDDADGGEQDRDMPPPREQ
jgi:hypothetical protein